MVAANWFCTFSGRPASRGVLNRPAQQAERENSTRGCGRGEGWGWEENWGHIYTLRGRFIAVSHCNGQAGLG